MSGLAFLLFVFANPGIASVASAAPFSITANGNSTPLSARIITTSNFSGAILCQTLIALNTGAVLNGRALAQTAVTLNAGTAAAYQSENWDVVLVGWAKERWQRCPSSEGGEFCCGCAVSMGTLHFAHPTVMEEFIPNYQVDGALGEDPDVWSVGCGDRSRQREGVGLPRCAPRDGRNVRWQTDGEGGSVYGDDIEARRRGTVREAMAGGARRGHALGEDGVDAGIICRRTFSPIHNMRDPR